MALCQCIWHFGQNKKFLEKWSLPKLTWKETLGSSVSNFKIKFVTKNLSIRETLGPENFTSKFHRKFKEIPKTHITRKLQPISPMKVHVKIFHKTLTYQNQQHVKKIIYHGKVGFISGIQCWFNMWNQENHDFNKCRKNIWQNLTTLHNKNSQ